jgi:hypothetical protein
MKNKELRIVPEMIVSEVSILSILPKNFPFGFDR